MIYPKNFEQKIGFNEIRVLLNSHCLSSMGRGRVEQMQFETTPQVIRQLHQQVQEFQQVMTEQTELPEDSFYDLGNGGRIHVAQTLIIASFDGHSGTKQQCRSKAGDRIPCAAVPCEKACGRHREHNDGYRQQQPDPCEQAHSY